MMSRDNKISKEIKHCSDSAMPAMTPFPLRTNLSLHLPYLLQPPLVTSSN